MRESTLYVGIDISKLSLDVAITGDGKNFLDSFKVPNDDSGFKKIVRIILKHQQKTNTEKVHICLESSGIYTEKLFNFLQEETDFIVSRINPSKSNAFAKSLLLRTKTDKVDAKLLAIFCSCTKPDATLPQKSEMKKFKSLARFLHGLVQKKAELKTQLESVSSEDFTVVLHDLIKFYEKKILYIEKKIKAHVGVYSELKRQIELLQSIPGIGETSSAIILSELLDENPKDGCRYSKKVQSAHAGLAPSEKQSGTSIKGKPHLCKIGNAHLRKSLYWPAIVATKYNPFIKKFYERLLQKGKPKMVAIVACMRKLLMIAIGVLNNNAPFDPTWVSKSPFRRTATS